jgi:hypothetical protein
VGVQSLDVAAHCQERIGGHGELACLHPAGEGHVRAVHLGQRVQRRCDGVERVQLVLELLPPEQ